MTKKELNLYSKLCTQYDKTIKIYKTGTLTEFKKAVEKLNKIRKEFCELTGNRTEQFELYI